MNTIARTKFNPAHFVTNVWERELERLDEQILTAERDMENLPHLSKFCAQAVSLHYQLLKKERDDVANRIDHD